MEQVVQQYQSGLLHYAHHLCRRFSWACDVVQETFTKLWEHHQAGKRFESESHRRAWLYRVCRQRAIDLYRKEQRMSSIETEQVPDPVSSDPAQLAELKDQQDQLERQLESLTNKQQEIVRLKFHAGLSYQEIAQVTGLTVTNVGYQLHTAISKLKDRLGPAT